MASSDYRQVTTLVQRLGRLLNPVALVELIREVISAVSEPPPGDPDALDRLAAAYRQTAAELRSLVPHHAVQAFTEAADALAELAGTVRTQQRRQVELRLALRAAAHDATHIGSVALPDPTALDDVARRVNELVAVYTDSLDAADRAAARFTDLAGRARAAAGVEGGLAPATAVLLAGQMVSIPGIGDDYDDGILSAAQLRAAGWRVHGLAEADRVAFTGLLSRAGSDRERAWLHKALAAGHPVAELTGFAEEIRGRDALWLDSHLSLIDRGGAGNQRRLGHDVRQYEDTTCGTTCLIVARAECDPLYALSLTTADFPARFAAERARVHDQTNLLWPESLGTSPRGMARYLSAHTGVRYAWHLVDDTDHRRVSSTLREVVAAADFGTPAPVLVGGPVPRHYVLVVGHSAGAVLVYEPTSGDTVRVEAHDFLAGTLTASTGFAHLQAVVVPDTMH
ncbi:hypothetical protein [Actinophytocola sp.]|uniref:hypothetical protein n=1 Tax=Actinophytocola sp. TaxID=1872138 RepID=UPI002D7E21F6|nr:hypothetical protein [Actinophytocola sp.]HET9142562.1 hypothetical protein [Actinophytocola sp.]